MTFQVKDDPNDENDIRNEFYLPKLVTLEVLQATNVDISQLIQIKNSCYKRFKGGCLHTSFIQSNCQKVSCSTV